MTQLHRLSLLFWTLRYVTPTQMKARAKRTIRRRWWNLTGRRATQTRSCDLASFSPLWQGLAAAQTSGQWSEDVDAAIQRARNIAEGRFEFLNHAVDFKGLEPNQIGWHDSKQSQLWRYHLHYFDYVRDLALWAAAGETAPAYATFKALASSWMDTNQAISGDGWHPYTISLRTVNWLHGSAVFELDLAKDDAFRGRLLSSLHEQTEVLFADLELDVRGNHLLENLRALLWAGRACKGVTARRWLQKGLSLLQQEAAEQIADDGGHFERCPGYHLVVLKDCLEMALWLRRNTDQVPVWLDAALRRMLDYLVTILPPDGNVPLLKDTAWDAAPDPQDLLAAGALYFDERLYKRNEKFGLYPLLMFGSAGREKFGNWPLNENPIGSQALAASGHFVMRDDAIGDYLILDAGKPCPDYLPAHAHADIFTYELLAGGQRVLVDSGIYEYAAGPWRNYFRSTRAHNTVEVAKANQSEVWSSFRVARRARVRHVNWQNTSVYSLVQAEHDGYGRLKPAVKHRRTLVWCKAGFWLVVDELWGETIKADNHLHLHPNLNWTSAGSGWLVEGHAQPLRVAAFGHQSASIARGQMEPERQGWHSEKFGQIAPASVLTLHGVAKQNLCFGYVLARNSPAQIQLAGSSLITVSFEDQVFTLQLDGKGEPRFS